MSRPWRRARYVQYYSNAWWVCVVGVCSCLPIGCSRASSSSCFPIIHVFLLIIYFSIVGLCILWNCSSEPSFEQQQQQSRNGSRGQAQVVETMEWRNQRTKLEYHAQWNGSIRRKMGGNNTKKETREQVVIEKTTKETTDSRALLYCMGSFSTVSGI